MTGRVHLDHPVLAEDFAFVREIAPEGMTPKLTIPSPSMVHYRATRGDRPCDLLNDPAQRAEIEERGEDATHLHETYIRAFNDAITQRPASLRVTTHTCAAATFAPRG